MTPAQRFGRALTLVCLAGAAVWLATAYLVWSALT